jgi:DNA-directed RNA polymerase specialized sigma24 family protein
MGRSVAGRRRHLGSDHWKFDGVQFLAHVGHDQPLIDPVDFLARVVDQLHYFGLRHALLGPARDEGDAGGMEREMTASDNSAFVVWICACGHRRTSALCRLPLNTITNSSSEGDPSNYPATQWTGIIEVIQKGDDKAAWSALEDFCEGYRPAVYNFFRRRGVNHADAEEYTQEFFLTRIHERWDVREGFLFSAHREQKSKFRCFLCAVLRCFLIDKWRKLQRAPLQVDDPNPILNTLDMASDDDPCRFDREFDRAIALEIFQKAAGNSTHSRYLLAHFRNEITQAEAAEALQIKENAFKQSFSRFRKSFPINLRNEVKKLVGPEKSEIDAEIKHLISIFAHAKS